MLMMPAPEGAGVIAGGAFRKNCDVGWSKGYLREIFWNNFSFGMCSGSNERTCFISKKTKNQMT